MFCETAWGSLHLLLPLQALLEGLPLCCPLQHAAQWGLGSCHDLGSEKQTESSWSAVGTGCPWRSTAKLGFYCGDPELSKIWKGIKRGYKVAPWEQGRRHTRGFVPGPQVWHMLRTEINSLQPFDSASTTCLPAWDGPWLDVQGIGSTLGGDPAPHCPSPPSTLQEEHC